MTFPLLSTFSIKTPFAPTDFRAEMEQILGNAVDTVGRPGMVLFVQVLNICRWILSILHMAMWHKTRRHTHGYLQTIFLFVRTIK
jgi:hypothetical protein